MQYLNTTKAPEPAPAPVPEPASAPAPARPEKSLWSRLKDAHRTTAENVQIEVLRQKYVGLVNMGLELTPERSLEAMAKFVGLANHLRPHFSNWSEDGFMQMAKRIAAEARDEQHLDKTSAISKGLIAVWLESHARDHWAAQVIRTDLDGNIDAYNEQRKPSRPNPMPTATDQLTDLFQLLGVTEEQVRSPQYGYSVNNPILCKDIVTSLFFMDALRQRGRPVRHQRMGAEVGPGNRMIDHYVVSDETGVIADLYVDAHAGEAGSWQAPNNFTLEME